MLRIFVRIPVPAALVFALLFAPLLRAQTPEAVEQQFARDSKQPIDQAYTAAIKKYTTEADFNSSLTDYLPASSTVPTPAKVLGDVAGAPNMLPYAEDVYAYFRQLAASSPRVKVYSIGKTEEGREMIAAAIADPALLDKAKENDARLAKLADPRTIGMNDATAESLVNQSFPVYYITGTIHSTETGAPTALMELAYRLAVDNSPYIQYIRKHMIVLITPVVEVDGRDRMVDIYKWHRAHPDQNWPHLVYWGHYVAHDNNRDAMAMTLNLTNNVLHTYLDWHAQVLHDLHESVPFLYDNTVGDGPYNAWIDPLLSDEWAMLGWNNVASMQNLGMPGVFTHGDFDTWSPGYLMFLAGMHNGISRLYETFGNGGADTERRILDPEEYERTWFRQNPPKPSVIWSQRDNNNYEQSALLVTLSYFAQNSQHFLNNYYLKSKRSIEKPKAAGPAAYVFASDPALLNRQIQLLKVMEAQHVEIQKLTSSASVMVDVPKADDEKKDASAAPAKKSVSFPAGSYVVRMDQPYSRAADALLDRQYWSPEDPQKHPYDDTGWSFGDLFQAGVTRVVDASILNAPMTRVDDLASGWQATTGTGQTCVVDNTGQIGLAALAYATKPAQAHVLDNAADMEGKHFHAGSIAISGVAGDQLAATLTKLQLQASCFATMPSVPMHVASLPRIAFMHTWTSTQTEGWWREAFDKLQIPYDYISTQAASREADLHGKYDVIIFAPLGYSGSRHIIDGMPMTGNAIPWQKTALTPNIGVLDSTDDMRPGLGFSGVAHLKKFVEEGGLLITAEDTAQFAIDEGMAPGVFAADTKEVKVVGSVLGAVVVDAKSPVAFGLSPDLAVYSADGMAFNVSNLTVGSSSLPTKSKAHRPTGRGGPDDTDEPEGRPADEVAQLPDVKPWEAVPLNEEQRRHNPYVIPVDQRPDVVLRFADNKKLLISGLLDKGDSIAEHALVVDAHDGKGNVLLFGNNPIYRGETLGTYALVFNAILNWDHLAPAVSPSDAAAASSH
jgi:hypothetical protein